MPSISTAPRSDQQDPEARPAVAPTPARRRRPPAPWRSGPCTCSSRDRDKAVHPVGVARAGAVGFANDQGRQAARDSMSRKSDLLHDSPPARGERSSSSLDGTHCTAEIKTPSPTRTTAMPSARSRACRPALGGRAVEAIQADQADRSAASPAGGRRRPGRPGPGRRARLLAIGPTPTTLPAPRSRTARWPGR